VNTPDTNIIIPTFTTPIPEEAVGSTENENNAFIVPSDKTTVTLKEQGKEPLSVVFSVSSVSTILLLASGIVVGLEVYRRHTRKKRRIATTMPVVNAPQKSWARQGELEPAPSQFSKQTLLEESIQMAPTPATSSRQTSASIPVAMPKAPSGVHISTSDMQPLTMNLPTAVPLPENEELQSAAPMHQDLPSSDPSLEAVMRKAQMGIFVLLDNTEQTKSVSLSGQKE
jgi:hypothetical protein